MTSEKIENAPSMLLSQSSTQVVRAFGLVQRAETKAPKWLLPGSGPQD